MRISGFSFARNTLKLGYPLVESIRSILPICDEFVVAIGKGDADDCTRETVAALRDPKIKIIDTVWADLEQLKSGIYSQQTNLALNHCQGDWCFYIQLDEVIHEKYLPVIRNRCIELLDDQEVEGLLFGYKHFWGDYDHYCLSHAWYPREIRMVRNGIGVESIGDAQSFKLHGRKLKVATVDAEVFHYGWVRPPRLMQTRNAAVRTTYTGATAVSADPPVFNFGSLEKLPVYSGSYPQVMRARIAAMDWREQLQYRGASSVRFKHTRLKYRILTFFEQKVLGGRQILGYRNYRIIRA
jgi:hypothetical protein